MLRLMLLLLRLLAPRPLTCLMLLLSPKAPEAPRLRLELGPAPSCCTGLPLLLLLPLLLPVVLVQGGTEAAAAPPAPAFLLLLLALVWRRRAREAL